MTLLSLFTMLCWMLAAAGIAAYVASIAMEVTYVTLADGRRQERSIPLLFRVLLPFVGNLDSIVTRPAFVRQRALADEMLVSAGFEGLLTGHEFVALKLMIPLLALIVSLLTALLWNALLADFGVSVPVVVAAGFAVAYVYPLVWLRGSVKRRHTAIQRALPFVLDLLTLSVEAGMDFISALQRNCKLRRLDPLNEELLRMTKEIQIGSSRKEALRGMAERVRQPDLKSVALALIQADELGVSIGSMLRIQSEQLRSRRFDRAEKLAAEAPVKMLGPLMLCIFPAVFVMLLGPILGQAMQGAF